jgi:hypothetical protein
MAKLTYLGGGFLPNVPARNLSAAEAKRYGIDKLTASGLYQEIKPKPKPKKADTAEEQED